MKRGLLQTSAIAMNRSDVDEFQGGNVHGPSDTTAWAYYGVKMEKSFVSCILLDFTVPSFVYLRTPTMRRLMNTESSAEDPKLLADPSRTGIQDLTFA